MYIHTPHITIYIRTYAYDVISSTNIHPYTYIHTLHTCIHTLMLHMYITYAYISSETTIGTYIHTHTYMNTLHMHILQAHMHVCIHIHAYITYAYTYAHSYIDIHCYIYVDMHTLYKEILCTYYNHTFMYV